MTSFPLLDNADHVFRFRRLLSQRAIGCQLLLLIVLWHFDGTSAEASALWRFKNNLSADVSSMAIAKDVIIFNHEEQSASVMWTRDNFVIFLLACPRDAFSFFARPIGWGARSVVLSASENNILNSSRQLIIISKDNITVAGKITTSTGRYSWGETIILVTVAEYGWPNYIARYNRGGREALLRSGFEAETIINRADIGAELPPFHVISSVRLESSVNGGDSSKYAGSYEERKDPIVKGMFPFAAGVVLLVIGIWCTMFIAPRHQPSFLIICTAIIIIACLMIVFCDVVATMAASRFTSSYLFRYVSLDEAAVVTPLATRVT